MPGTAQAVTNGDGSNTPLGSLLGSLSYRGAEHPYLVGNVADAVKRFGAASPQAAAARSGLTNNVDALAGLLASNGSQRTTFATGLATRDTTELAYAAAVVSGDVAAQNKAKADLSVLAARFATAVHAAIPAVSVSALTGAVKTLNAGDEVALQAAALNRPTQFAAVEKGSASLASDLQTVGLALAKKRGYAGVSTLGDGALVPDNGALYRGQLEAAFTEHVYQTGLFGMAILKDGPRSAATVAARAAENVNTALDAALLGELGTGFAHTQQVWNTHITGYGDYLTGLATGSSTQIADSGPLLSSYEAGITSLVKKAVPAFGTSTLRSSYTEHVTGTLEVFRLEKANSASLYPTALMGAHHFSDLATDIANKQQEIRG